MSDNSPRNAPRDFPQPSTHIRSRKSSVPLRPGFMTFAAAAPKTRACRISMICCSSARRCRAYPLEGYREKCGHRGRPWGGRFRQQADHAQDACDDCGNEFRRVVRPGEGSAGAVAASGRRHVDDHRRRRHDSRGARSLQKRSSTNIFRLATGMNPDDLRKGRRHRGCRRAGREAGRRRHVCSVRRSVARVAAMRDLPEGIDQRSACRHPRLDWPGRSRDQDRRAARDHGIGRSRSM